MEIISNVFKYRSSSILKEKFRICESIIRHYYPVT